jgi:hypothetical protein
MRPAIARSIGFLGTFPPRPRAARRRSLGQRAGRIQRTSLLSSHPWPRLFCLIALREDGPELLGDQADQA